MRGNFLGNKMLLTLKRQNFVQFFCFWKNVLNIVWIRIWSRNRNQNFSKVGTGTATKSVGFYNTYYVHSEYITSDKMKIQQYR